MEDNQGAKASKEIEKCISSADPALVRAEGPVALEELVYRVLGQAHLNLGRLFGHSRLGGECGIFSRYLLLVRVFPSIINNLQYYAVVYMCSLEGSKSV